MSIANPSTQLDLRTLSPLYVPVVVAVTGLLVTWWRSLGGRRMQQLALAILVGLVVTGDLGQTLLWVREGQSNGLGYASRAWQMSPLLDRALALPPDKQIFTNGIDIIASYAGRPAFGLPQKAGNPDVYVARLAVAERHLRQRDAVLVYFDTLDPYPPLSPYPSVQEVSQSVPLRLIDREADGAIYAAE